MAYISSGVACSHVPALGVASDTGIADDDYYGPIFKGFEYSKQWIAEEKPDCLLYTSPSPRDRTRSRMPSSA